MCTAVADVVDRDLPVLDVVARKYRNTATCFASEFKECREMVLDLLASHRHVLGKVLREDAQAAFRAGNMAGRADDLLTVLVCAIIRNHRGEVANVGSGGATGACRGSLAIYNALEENEK